MLVYLKALNNLLIKRDRQALFGLLALTIFLSMIELVGVSSIFPYIKIISDPEIIFRNHTLSRIYHFFGLSNTHQFLILMGSFIFFMVVFKGFFSFLNNYFQGLFSATVRKRLSKACLSSYIYLPYSELLSRNSAILMKHLLTDVPNITTVISAVLTIMTNICVGSVLIALMLVVDPWLIMGTLAVLLSFLYASVRFTRARMNRLAKLNEYSNRMAYKTANEALSGVKDLKIFNVEPFFIEKYTMHQDTLSNQIVENNVIATLPTITMNVVGFGVLLVLLLYLLATHSGNIVSVLPTIGIVAVCVQRLLPMVSTIAPAIGTIRKFKPVVLVMHNVLGSALFSSRMPKAQAPTDAPSFSKSLQFKQLSYTYPEGSKKALDNITFSIKKNTSLGIIGTSGSGKSTLVDVLLGLLKPESGEIWCDDLNITVNSQRLNQLVGYVPQQTFLLDGSIEENIAYGIEQATIDPKAVANAVKIAQLEELIADLPNGLKTHIGEKGAKLSGGQRQRIGIAACALSRS